MLIDMTKDSKINGAAQNDIDNHTKRYIELIDTLTLRSFVLSLCMKKL